MDAPLDTGGTASEIPAQIQSLLTIPGGLYISPDWRSSAGVFLQWTLLRWHTSRHMALPCRASWLHLRRQTAPTLCGRGVDQYASGQVLPGHWLSGGRAGGLLLVPVA